MIDPVLPWQIIPDDEVDDAMRSCGWCAAFLHADDAVIGVTAKCLVPVDRYAGKLVMVPLTEGRAAVAVVGTADSQLRREGKDLAFMCCRDECAAELIATCLLAPHVLAEPSSGPMN